MLFSGGQKIKNVTKIEQKRLFFVRFLVSFFWRLYIFNFLFGSFFEQDHLLNLFVLGIYAKR